MNIRNVVFQLSKLVFVLSGLLLLIGVGTFVMKMADAEVDGRAAAAFFISGLIGIISGALGVLVSRGRDLFIGRREALLLVASSWLVGAAFAGLPYLLWAHFRGPELAEHPFRSFIDSYFEAMSGLTTTGATVLSDVEAVPRSLLLWRSLTQWLGGLGIVVLFVAVLPSLGVGGKKLFRVEAAGPSPKGFQPHIRDTARMLLVIYVGLTVAQTLLLWMTEMDLFEAVCHTFTTLSTGGFSTRNASIAYWDSPAIETIIIVFMLLGGVNFALYFQLVRRRFRSVWEETEFRVFLSIILIGCGVVVLSLLSEPVISSAGLEAESSWGSAIRHGVFQVVSIQTTTGFVTADFDRWDFIAKTVLITLMFIGGSAGSTGGGIKVIRVWITFKVMIDELEKVFRPNVVRPVLLGHSAIDDELKLGTVTYLLGILLLAAGGSVALMLLEGDIDFTTAATAAISTLNNIGPGFARVGAIQNFGWFTDGSKLVMCLLMALGRLEVFAIVVLLTPRFWRSV